MKRRQALTTVLYGYISFAFLMVIIDAFGLFHPIPDIIAAVSLLMACYYAGRYGKAKG